MIYGFVGRLGHGKTMRMVVWGLQLAERRGALDASPRCWVASNIGLNVPAGMVFRHLSMDRFSPELAALMAEARAASVGLVVLVDEIDEVWDAHEWQKMKRGDRYRIKQSRKLGADLGWTAQFVDQAEKSIRNITEEVTLVRAIPPPTIQRRETGKRPVLIYGQRFRPGALRELTGTADKDKRLGTSWWRYRREHELLYDTDELVTPPDLVDEDGRLCAKHRKEAAELACPRCLAGDPGGLGQFVAAAIEDPEPAFAA